MLIVTPRIAPILGLDLLDKCTCCHTEMEVTDPWSLGHRKSLLITNIGDNLKWIVPDRLLSTCVQFRGPPAVLAALCNVSQAATAP